MKAKLAILAILMWMLCICAGDTLAADRKGSLTLMLPVSGGEITLHRVGQIPAEKSTPEYAKILEAELHELGGISGKVGEDGRVVFAELEPDTYLVCQTEAVIGYQKIQPFFVMIPMRQEGGWVYDICAFPKTEPLPVDPENPDTGGNRMCVIMFLLSAARVVLLIFARDGTRLHFRPGMGGA